VYVQKYLTNTISVAVHTIPFCHQGSTHCLACLRKQSRCCFWNTVCDGKVQKRTNVRHV